MRVVAYVRVSTAEQTQGTSLGSQEATMRAECERRAWDLCDVVTESASGKSLRRRPALSSALERLDSGEFDALMVARLDRLSRSVGDFAGILDRARRGNWSVVCLAPHVDMTDAYGRTMAYVAAAFAELERELIGQRQRESVAARKAAGTYRGPQPLIGPVAVSRILRLYGQGLNAEQIARALNEEGLPPVRAQKWAPRTVRSVLARERRTPAN